MPCLRNVEVRNEVKIPHILCICKLKFSEMSGGTVFTIVEVSTKQLMNAFLSLCSKLVGNFRLLVSFKCNFNS